MTCPTITGDHEDRITDYTACVVEAERLHYLGQITDHPIPTFTEDGAAETIRARDFKAPTCVAYAVDCRNAKIDDVNGTLQAKESGGVSLNCNNVVLQEAYPQVDEGVLGTLDSHYAQVPGCRGGIERTIVAEQLPFTFQERAGCAGGGKGVLVQDGHTGALSTLTNQFLVYCVDQGAGKSTCSVSCDSSPTLSCTHDGAPAVAYRKTSHPTSAEGEQGWEETDASDTLNVFDNSEARTPTLVVEGAVGIDCYNQTLTGEVAKTLTERAADNDHVPCVAYWDGTQTVGTLTANNAGGNQRMPDKDNFNCVIEYDDNVRYIVRRLTPRETERLQFFPDDWTDIGEWTDEKRKKRKTADAGRYKAMGNSICRTSWIWVLKRISALYERAPTMGSLFSGVGGFDLSWTQINGVGSVLWSSEIEPFPIAVLKRHFGDEATGEKGDVQKYL